ncbi:MAG: 5'-nucleotidase C-terminal domain-containing protein [Deinococcales bacterium]|nr:5'-nucleotidase C-terminal domain-containing protein [Chitinophagaceae bacterium]
MFRFVAALTAFLFIFSPVTNAQTFGVSYGTYRIDDYTKKDSALVTLLAIYKDSMNKTMRTVLGFSTDGLTKKQPESGLGNFMTDAMKTMAEKKFEKHIDAAFINYGGIRSYLPKGDITIGKIFELMPFDNVIVLQDIKGDTLLSFLHFIAERNGWPVSGISFTMNNRKATNILVNGKPLDTTATYTIANSDYIANGGDDVKMLKGIPQINKGYLVRDALIAYTIFITEKGESIDAKTEKRITYGR